MAEKWRQTNALIARTRKDNPDADTSELYTRMHQEKAEADIVRLAELLTAEQRERIGTVLLSEL